MRLFSYESFLVLGHSINRFSKINNDALSEVANTLCIGAWDFFTAMRTEDHLKILLRVLLDCFKHGATWWNQITAATTATYTAFFVPPTPAVPPVTPQTIENRLTTMSRRPAMGG